MSEYAPDVWEIVRITFGDETSHRVLAGWYGGYLGGDAWKISSAIRNVEEFDDYIQFYNESGSTYICRKDAKRLSGMTGSTLASLKEQAAEKSDIVVVLASVVFDSGAYRFIDDER